MDINTHLIASSFNDTVDLNQLQQVTLPGIPNPTIGGIVGSLIGTYVLPIAGFATLGMVVVGGYQYMLSYGDPKKITAAKEKITYGLIGFGVVFGSYWLIRIMGRILDIKAIKDIFGA